MKTILQGTIYILTLASLNIFTGCASLTATESHRSLEVQQVAAASKPFTGEKKSLVVGNFNNRSNYSQGIFSNGDIDKLGNQSKTILKTHLQLTNRFRLMDRDSLQTTSQEAEFLKLQQQIKGARYVVTGTVSEFGRKAQGDKQLFGILGKSKSQIAYAKVLLNVTDVISSEIVYSAQGAGEYKLSEREVLGFGTNTDYDSTLNGKVLNLAIIEAVNSLSTAIDNGFLKFK